jgi:NDP-sugar pyrophosphorylase family protein
MSNLAIEIMAAGLGSRFGGNKQLVDVGPNGEVFFDFAISDAIAAGADRVVLIVRREFADTVEQHVRAMHGDIDLHLVCQDEADAPVRKKPWGTAHAILTAKDAVDRPFIVVNADDYYGVESYRLVADALRDADDDRTVVLAAFELGRTLPVQGSVSRGVCAVGDGVLTGLVETHGIERQGDGRIVSTDPPSDLTDTTPVSMNMWGFPVSLFGHLERMWGEFLAAHRTEEKTEFLLPSAVAELRDVGRLDVKVVTTESDWIGVTNPDDLEPARATLAALRAR